MIEICNNATDAEPSLSRQGASFCVYERFLPAGAVAWIGSVINFTGDTYFGNNSAGTRGGMNDQRVSFQFDSPNVFGRGFSSLNRSSAFRLCIKPRHEQSFFQQNQRPTFFLPVVSSITQRLLNQLRHPWYYADLVELAGEVGWVLNIYAGPEKWVEHLLAYSIE